MPTLLIVDDEPNVLYSLEKGLREEGLTIRTASTAREGIAAARDDPPDAVLLDVQLPDLSGLEALERIRAADRKLPVMIMTAHGTAETAIEAMKRGAFDYILKPWKLADLKDLVRRALQAGRLSRVPAVFEDAPEQEQGDEAVDRILGRSPRIQEVFKEIGRVAPQDVNVLVLGESGTGKELVARAIYHHSRRSDQPFLAINCAAIAETLLESELFGHERGAFTGADRRRIGKFEQAHRGTLFLDEIGDMSAATQAKVLRILQDGRFERVGGSETIEVDVRILAATNKDLEQAIVRREFRQDLFYRLNTFTLTLPSLRERGDDVRLLAEHFLRRDSRELQADATGFSPPALDVLLRHDWPGNVRELESAVKYAVVHATGDVIVPKDFPPAVRGVSELSAVEPSPAAAMTGDNAETDPDEELSDVRRLVRMLLRQRGENVHDAVRGAVDRVILEEVLRFTDGHQTHAAELLGISRTTLRARLQQLGMSIERSVQSPSDPPGERGT